MTFAVFGLSCVLTSVFLKYEAQIFVEYVEATYIFLPGFGNIVILFALKVEMISKYIEALENMITSSECIQWW